MAGSLIIGLAGTKGMSGTSGTATVNLLSQLEVARGGFGYKSSGELQWTTFDLVSTLADSDFRNEIYKLDRIKEWAYDYGGDATFDTPIYLKWASDNETQRQTVVHDLEYEIIPEEQLGAMLGHNAAKVRLTVQHNPYWEAATAIANNTVATISDIGGTVVFGGYDTSYPSRLKTFTIADAAFVTPSATKTKVWAGIRDFRNGVSGFIPKWECEKGANSTDASDGTVAGASNGTAVNVTFATNSAMTKRFTVLWSNIATASYDDIIGRYLVLARMKLSGTTVETAVELKHGWLGITGLESSVGMNYVSAVTDANFVNWNYIPLGVVDVPPTGDRDSVASSGASPWIMQYGMSIYAERLGTSGSASFDCLLLIPSDHLMTVGSANINYDNGQYIKAFIGDDDTPYVLNAQLAGVGNVEYSFENWNMPIQGGVMVLAAQGATSSGTTSSIISYDLVQRFRSYRGTA